ncbi:solute carrier organic anion transporter family member 74D-like [Panulirus ornatus]|uniref:solute carrier organic anion transporter family member 74D-like n=1 Tax=Panulirus ornatus TaxID=150431 RepID=UPI003A8C31D1
MALNQVLSRSGTILSGNDLSQIILSIVLGYYGNYGNRPRWMGIGVMCAALSGFAAALPHFIYGPGKDAIAVARAAASGDTLLQNLTALSAETKKEELCFFQPEEICGEDGGGAGGGESYLGPIILFFVSQFLFGVTLSIFYSLGITYLDDNISKKVYPIYYSITFMLRILGPVLGFFVGGKCLSVWIDPSIQPNISRRDPRWFGAWWIGFLFIGFALLFSGSFLFLFPRKLPTTLKREAKRAARLAEKEEKAGGKRRVEFFASLAKSQRQEEKPNMKSLGKALKRLFTNKIWVGNLFNTSVYLLGVAGYWNFKPKYLETQFRQSATTASYYTGESQLHLTDASLLALVYGTGLVEFILRFCPSLPQVRHRLQHLHHLLMCCSYIILKLHRCPETPGPSSSRKRSSSWGKEDWRNVELGERSKDIGKAPLILKFETRILMLLDQDCDETISKRISDDSSPTLAELHAMCEAPQIDIEKCRSALKALQMEDQKAMDHLPTVGFEDVVLLDPGNIGKYTSHGNAL